MLKRLATIGCGLGLIGLGVFFFLAPEQAYLVQLLKRCWPLFLVLAGLVRLAGYLLDRQPRSPVGSLLLIVLGGAGLDWSWRGESSLTALVARYWFWLLLAYVSGRLLRQYLHGPAAGRAPRAFSPGGVLVMLLLTATGLSASYLKRNTGLVAQLNARFGQFGTMGDYVFGDPIRIDDEPPQSFKLPANVRLIFNGFPGELELRAVAAPQATARLTKYIRTADAQRARASAQGIRLQITPNGSQLQFVLLRENPAESFTVALVVEVPAHQTAGIEVNEASGAVKLSDLRGEHTLRNCARVEVTRQQGRLTIESPRGPVALRQLAGELTLTGLQHRADLDDLQGKLTLTARGGAYRFNNVLGAVRASVAGGRLELRGIRMPPSFPAAEKLVQLDGMRDTQINLREINGHVAINAMRSRIEADTVTGDLQIAATAESVRLARCQGNVRVTAENGSVTVTELKGAALIEATRDLSVQNFSGPLQVKSRTGKLTLTHAGALAGDLSAVNEYGQTLLTLPADISFRLEASTGSGRLRARGFEGIALARNQKAVNAAQGTDGKAPLVSLRSTTGNIELQAAGLALASRNGQ